jgi:hypothetical protein
MSSRGITVVATLWLDTPSITKEKFDCRAIVLRSGFLFAGLEKFRIIVSFSLEFHAAAIRRPTTKVGITCTPKQLLRLR